MDDEVYLYIVLPDYISFEATPPYCLYRAKATKIGLRYRIDINDTAYPHFGESSFIEVSPDVFVGDILTTSRFISKSVEGALGKVYSFLNTEIGFCDDEMERLSEARLELLNKLSALDKLRHQKLPLD